MYGPERGGGAGRGPGHRISPGQRASVAGVPGEGGEGGAEGGGGAARAASGSRTCADRPSLPRHFQAAPAAVLSAWASDLLALL